MTSPHAKDQVDPHRFTGKILKRRPTFPGVADDFVIRIDGLVAGRIMEDFAWPKGSLVLDPYRPIFSRPQVA